MDEFPKLKTGAVTQYPAQSAIGYSTRVLRFVDGSEQRFRESAGVSRRWIVRLDLLDEDEMTKIEQFFVARQGSLDDFVFVDPSDGVQYPNCRLEGDTLALEHADVGRGRATLIVRQNPA